MTIQIKIFSIWMSDVNGRIYRCAANLSRWNASNRKELRRDIDLKKKELAEASSSLKLGSWRAIRRIESQLDNLLAQKEKFWQQRARQEWLKSEIVIPNSSIRKPLSGGEETEFISFWIQMVLCA